MPSFHYINSPSSIRKSGKETPSHPTATTSPIAGCSQDVSLQSCWHGGVTSPVHQGREPDVFSTSTSALQHFPSSDASSSVDDISHHNSREVDSSPWKKSVSINKENNKNTLNKTEEIVMSGYCKELAALDSPGKSKVRMDKVKLVKEADLTKKLTISKEGKENKENEQEVKECSKEKLKPSPLCLRRQGSKCDLKSPGEQQKYGSVQGSVSIILEKSIIC